MKEFIRIISQRLNFTSFDIVWMDPITDEQHRAKYERDQEFFLEERWSTGVIALVGSSPVEWSRESKVFGWDSRKVGCFLVGQELRELRRVCGLKSYQIDPLLFLI